MRIVALFALLLVSAAAPLFAQKTTPTYTLAEAVAQKLIDFKLEGAGGHTGESLTLNCRNMKSTSFRIKIPIGQMMEPSDSNLQTLVIAEEMTFAMQSKASRALKLKAFCAQAGDGSPSEGSLFAVGAMGPEKLVQLLKFVTENNIVNDGDIQSAVWCVTNGHHPASIGDAKLKTFTATLVGRDVPQYRIRYHTEDPQPGQRADWGKALVVESQFQYTLEKDTKLDMLLLDGEGKTIKVLRKDELAKAGEHRSGMKLEVYNLDPGKYTVRLQKKNGEVIKDMLVEF
ncbi:MAG: hypothetical protein IT270_16345 [Saprospiraceae bacterium]|nr:hypothetical protein [Saprospiraceae bacterium]